MYGVCFSSLLIKFFLFVNSQTACVLLAGMRILSCLLLSFLLLVLLSSVWWWWWWWWCLLILTILLLDGCSRGVPCAGNLEPQWAVMCAAASDPSTPVASDMLTWSCLVMGLAWLFSPFGCRTAPPLRAVLCHWVEVPSLYPGPREFGARSMNTWLCPRHAPLPMNRVYTSRE